jgi:hypothetical protein
MFRARGSGYRVQGPGLRVQDLWCTIFGFGFGVQLKGFQVLG